MPRAGSTARARTTRTEGVPLASTVAKVIALGLGWVFFAASPLPAAARIHSLKSVHGSAGRLAGSVWLEKPTRAERGTTTKDRTAERDGGTRVLDSVHG